MLDLAPMGEFEGMQLVLAVKSFVFLVRSSDPFRYSNDLDLKASLICK